MERQVIGGTFRAIYRLLRFNFALRWAFHLIDVRIDYSEHVILLLVCDKCSVFSVFVLNHRIFFLMYFVVPQKKKTSSWVYNFCNCSFIFKLYVRKQIEYVQISLIAFYRGISPE